MGGQTRYRFPMRVGILQTNPIIGDFDYNLRSILTGYEQASKEGAVFVVAAPSSLMGVPIKNLGKNRDFLQLAEVALKHLASRVGSIPLLVDTFCLKENGEVARQLVVLRNGQIQQSYFALQKGIGGLLPDFRLIDPGSTFLLKEGDITPIDLILEMSPTPWFKGVEKERLNSLRKLAGEKACCPVIAPNVVGGADGYVFFGESVVITAEGKIKAIGKAFEEQIIMFDFAAVPSVPENLEGGVCESERLYRALTMGIRDFVHKTGFKKVVLGLSGGIDSAVVAVLAADALGPENVLCVSIPSRYTTRASVEDAKTLASNLGVRLEIIPLEPLYSAWEQTLGPLFVNCKPDITEENVQARLRAVILMSLSNKFGYLLLNTGNKSEIATGYCTLYGDSCGALSVIGDLYKTEVYTFAQWINSQRLVIPESILTKAPSAELRPGQTDQETLPPYESLDSILRLWLEEGFTIDEIVQLGYQREMVLDVTNRVIRAAFKRKQGPPVIRVSWHGLGFASDLPVSQKLNI